MSYDGIAVRIKAHGYGYEHLTHGWLVDFSQDGLFGLVCTAYGRLWIELINLEA